MRPLRKRRRSQPLSPERLANLAKPFSLDAFDHTEADEWGLGADVDHEGGAPSPDKLAPRLGPGRPPKAR